MSYKIGAVSKILRISEQMIRYYEKCGVIRPERTKNGYREYSVLDMFTLYEATKYSKMGIDIAEIGDFISSDILSGFTRQMIEKAEQLENEISYNTLLHSRVEYLRDQLISASYNIGNIWIENLQAHYMYYMGSSVDEDYNIDMLKIEMANHVYNNKQAPFFDSVTTIGDNKMEWWYSIDKRYHDKFSLPDVGKYKKVEAQPCATTIIDMGAVGEFNEKVFNPLKEWLDASQHQSAGQLEARIIARGYQEGQFRRIMKAYIPIKTL